MEHKPSSTTLTRRDAMVGATQSLAAIAVVVIGMQPASAAKPKASKDDFFFQEEPSADGNRCENCINYTAKATGHYGRDTGDCDLLEGDVCKQCYCQGWVDKNDPKAKRAGA